LDAEAEDFLRAFSDFSRLLIRHQCSRGVKVLASSSVCDLIDVALFIHVLSKLENLVAVFDIRSKADIISHLVSVDIMPAFAVSKVQEFDDSLANDLSAGSPRPCTHDEELGVEQLKRKSRTAPNAASAGLSDQNTQD
jgi:hypothetical protein